MAKEAGMKLKDQTAEKMKEGAGKITSAIMGRAHDMGGNAAVVQSLANKSGEQMISAFLVQSLRSAKSRREQTSLAASEAAQTLVLEHSRALIDPLHAAAKTLVGSIGTKIFESTIDVIHAFVLRRVYAVRTLANNVLTFFSDAVIPAPLEALIIKHGGSMAKTALQLVAVGLLLLLARVIGQFLGMEVLGGIAVGAIAGLVLTASYERNRALRAKLASIASTEWHVGYKKEEMAALGINEDLLEKRRVETEGVSWLNTVLSTLWPKIAHHLGAMIMSGSNDILDHFKPSFLSSLGVTTCELGNLPIEIRKLKVNKLNHEELEITATATWQGQVHIDLEMETAGAVKFRNEIRSLFFRGEFKIIAAPLVDVLPGFAALRVSLVSPPKLDFDVNIKTVVSPPAVVAFLKRFLLETVDDILLWPNSIVIPLLPEESVGPFIAPLIRSTKGIVRVEVLEARDLPNEDVTLLQKGGSDPYVLLDTARQEFITTKTINNTQTPAWNEVHYLQMFELNRKLHVEVWDADDASADDLLGRCSVRLLDLKPGCLHDSWYELGRQGFHSMEGTGTGFGRIRLAVTWWPVQLLQSNLGSGLPETDTPLAASTNKQKVKEGPVQEGVLLVKVQSCTNLPMPGQQGGNKFSTEVETASTKHKSPEILSADGAPSFSFSCQFYEIPVSEFLSVKVYSHDQKSPDLVGVLQVPLALPAMSPHGVLNGRFPLSGPEPTGSHVSVEVQWLPLDSNAIPLPSKKRDPEPGCLFIHMDRANDLVNADRNSLSDPYAVLKLGRMKKKTRVIDDDLNPVWDEHFHFMGSTQDVLNIHVYDKDLTSSESLGQVFLPVSTAAATQKGKGSTDTDGWTKTTMPLTGVKSGSIQIRTKWVPVYAFESEIAKAVRIRAPFNIKRLREIPPLLERSITMATPWRHNEEIVWQGCSTSTRMGRLLSRREELWGKLPLPGIAPSPLISSAGNGQQHSNAGGGEAHLGEGHEIEMNDADQHEYLVSRDIAESTHVMWDVVVVLHGLEGLSPKDTPASRLSLLRATLSIGDETHASSAKVNDWNPTWYEGFEWCGVPLNSEENLVVSFSSSTETTAGLGNKIAEVLIPLACVRAKPQRFLSGLFELQNSDGSKKARAAGLEVCWLPHREEVDEGRGRTPWREPMDAPKSMVGTLHVNLGSASQLPAADSTGFSDPFCTLKVGEMRFVSSVKDQTLDPIWNEDFEFGSVTSDRVLHINCYDKDRFGRQHLGKIDIDIKDVAKAQDGKLSRPFPLKKGKKASQGHITLSLQWCGWAGTYVDDMSMRNRINQTDGGNGAASSCQEGAGNLEVLLKSATGLLAMDRNGLSDPYCTLKMRDSRQRYESKVKCKNLNPVWDSRFEFQSISSRDMLQVNVWDKDMMTNDLMGKLYIPVKDVIKNKGQLEQEWQLQLNGNPAGMLALALRWSSDAGTGGPTGAAKGGQRKKGSAVQGRSMKNETVSAHAAVKAMELRELREPHQLPDDAPSTREVPSRQPGSTFMGHEAQNAAETPASTQPPTPALSKAASLPRIPQPIPANHVRVMIHGLRDVAASLGLQSVFLALKLDKERRVTSAKTVSDEHGVKLGSVFDIPFYLDPSRLYLRVRLYEQRRFGRKAMVGETNINMHAIGEERTLEGTWPLSSAITGLLVAMLDITMEF